jgi:hypothetical protein
MPLGFRGHDAFELYKRLAQRRQASLKGEFETTESYGRRMQAEAAKPLLGSLTQQSVFAFVIGKSAGRPGKLETEYDADRQILHATAKLSYAFDGSNLAGKALNWAEFVQEHSFHTGTTALGVRVRVERYVQLFVEIAFGNYEQFALAKLWDSQRDADFAKGLSERTRKSWEDIHQDTAFAADLNLDVPAAIGAKKNLRLLLVCRLAPPYAMESTGYIEPKIDSPHEESHYSYFLNTELLEIWFFDSVTGQIYAKQKAQVSGKSEVSPAIVLDMRTQYLISYSPPTMLATAPIARSRWRWLRHPTTINASRSRALVGGTRSQE